MDNICVREEHTYTCMLDEKALHSEHTYNSTDRGLMLPALDDRSSKINLTQRRGHSYVEEVRHQNEKHRWEVEVHHG